MVSLALHISVPEVDIFSYKTISTNNNIKKMAEWSYGLRIGKKRFVGLDTRVGSPPNSNPDRIHESIDVVNRNSDIGVV